MLSLLDESTPELPFTEDHIAAISCALQKAWELMPTYVYNILPTFNQKEYADEDKVTVRLCEVLNHFLDKKVHSWFTDRMFQTITRDSKGTDHTGKKIDLMPDLTFRLMEGTDDYPRTDCALHVECKVFHGQRGISLYVKNGVSRFVEGEYSPILNIGMMVAYVNNKKKLPKDLISYFDGRGKIAKKFKPTGSRLVSFTKPFSLQAFVSNHIRFNSSSMDLYHVWLEV